jgi:hypothetical protein
MSSFIYLKGYQDLVILKTGIKKNDSIERLFD